MSAGIAAAPQSAPVAGSAGPPPAAFSLAGLPALAIERAEWLVWVDDGEARTWAAFTRLISAAQVQCVAAGVAPGAVMITPGESRLESLAWLFAAAGHGAVVAPLRPGRTAEATRWQADVRLDWIVRDGRPIRIGEGRDSAAAGRLLEPLRSRGRPGLILATGGTTGVPKLVLHDLAALLATVPVRSGRARRTLPLMAFDHIGGLDMAWRALAGGQILVAPPAETGPEAVAAAVARHQVEVLPATPSFLNLLLLHGALGRHDLSSLRLVPYGAEPMPAGLLARLRAALPGVEFVQRFGTSETGTLPVRDREARLLLDRSDAGFAWKIVEDELWIRTPARALGYLAGDTGGFDAEGWFRTGDLAEQRADGTVAILGRRAELINVGGEKVLPGEVEGVLLAHPEVADCRVFPAPNAVLGQVVAAEVVWRGAERDPVRVKRALHQFAEGRLARHKLPVVVRLVEAVAATRNLKKQRSPLAGENRSA